MGLSWYTLLGMDTLLERLKRAFFDTPTGLRSADDRKRVRVIALSVFLALIIALGIPSLVIPRWLEPASIYAEAPEEAPAGTEDPAQFIEHVVSRGQTLSRIAMSYGATPLDLMEANGMSPEDTIYPGQKLKVPDSGTIQASWYGSWFNGRTMANSRPYHTTKRVIAHRYLPLGTCVELTNLKNNKTSVAEIQDRINIRYAHRWDLSPKVFTEDLGINPSVGVATLEYRIVDCSETVKPKNVALKTN